MSHLLPPGIKTTGSLQNLLFWWNSALYFFFQKLAARFIGNFIRCCHPKKSPGHDSHHCHHFWQQEFSEELKKISFSLWLTFEGCWDAPLSTTGSWVSPQTLNLLVHYSVTTTAVINITHTQSQHSYWEENELCPSQSQGSPVSEAVLLQANLDSPASLYELLLSLFPLQVVSLGFPPPVVLLLLSSSVLILFLDSIIKHTSNSLLPSKSFTNSYFWVALHQSTIVISHWTLPNMSLPSFFFWTPIYLLTHYSETPQPLPVASLLLSLPFTSHFPATGLAYKN